MDLVLLPLLSTGRNCECASHDGNMTEMDFALVPVLSLLPLPSLP